MRAISGKHWGANEQLLLVLYKTLVRSIIDYGAIAYDNATTSQLTKLDSIQYQALKIATGAMKGTSLASLQAHCNEMPLQLRRLELQIQYAAKVKKHI